MCRGGDCARRHLCHDEVVEQQSAARAGRAGFRSESGQTPARLCGSLFNSHSVCVSTGGRPRFAGSKRQYRYDHGVTLLDTWRAMESLVDHGRCRAIGLSDIGLNELAPLFESARIKPAVIQVEAHPYLPEPELLKFCREKGIVFLAGAPLGHGMKSGPLEDPVISSIASRLGRTPAQVLLAWA